MGHIKTRYINSKMFCEIFMSMPTVKQGDVLDGWMEMDGPWEWSPEPIWLIASISSIIRFIEPITNWQYFHMYSPLIACIYIYHCQYISYLVIIYGSVAPEGPMHPTCFRDSQIVYKQNRFIYIRIFALFFIWVLLQILFLVAHYNWGDPQCSKEHGARGLLGPPLTAAAAAAADSWGVCCGIFCLRLFSLSPFLYLCLMLFTTHCDSLRSCANFWNCFYLFMHLLLYLRWM